MGFVGTWISTAIATFVAIALVPGISAVGGSYLGPIMCALVLSMVNATIRPIMNVFSLPLNILSFGFFSLILNAIMLELASFLSRNLFLAGIRIESFGSAFLGALIISIVSSFVGFFLAK